MNPHGLVELLHSTIPAKLPVLIKGAPGIGKTDIVHQAASDLGVDVIISHPVIEDPTNYKGMPAVVNGKAKWLPFGDLQRLINAKRPTVAFMDDLGQAPPAVQAAAMQLLLARRIGEHAISDHITFVAATNRREDRAGVTTILEPVKSRFAAIVELQVDVDVWCEWAMANGIVPEVIAFIRFRPALLMDTETPTNDIVNRPCPRTVANLSRLFAAGVSDLEAYAGATGVGFATEFAGFLRVWRLLPDIDQVLSDPSSASVPNDPAALYALASVLAGRATAENTSHIMEYALRMPPEFSTLTIKDVVRQCPDAANNTAYIEWAVANQNTLV